MLLATSAFEIVVLTVLGGWLLTSLGVVSGMIKRVPLDFFRLAPRWNLFSAGQDAGQAALAIYYVDKKENGSTSEPMLFAGGVRRWSPSACVWSASLASVVFYRRLAKILIRQANGRELSELTGYRRLKDLVWREPGAPGAVSRRIMIYAERTGSEPELLFESPDEFL